MSDVTGRQPWRPSVARTLVVLLLVFVFSVSAMAAGGLFDESIDPSEATTRILTPDEAEQLSADEAASGSDERTAPVALIAALLLAAGGLLVSLAVPTRAEKRRAPAPAEPPRKSARDVSAPRRQMGAGVPESVPAPAPPLRSAAPVALGPIVPGPLAPLRRDEPDGRRRVGAKRPPSAPAIAPGRPRPTPPGPTRDGAPPPTPWSPLDRTRHARGNRPHDPDANDADGPPRLRVVARSP